MEAARQTAGGPALGALVQAVGETPVLHLARFGRDLPAQLWAKLELRSPTGSGKDRAALAIVDALEASGRLGRHQPLVVPSSGNLAVSLAWIAGARGHAVHAAIPRSSSLEFRQLLALYRAKLELTPSEAGLAGARARAKDWARDLDACHFDPFSDPLAVEGLRTLAEELRGLGARSVVCGLGSGATAAALRRFAPELAVVAVEPTESAIHSGLPRAPHKVHGIGVGFASEHLKGVEGVRFVHVSAAEAWSTKRRAAAEEGLFVGPTTGAVLAAARLEAAQANGPVVCIAMDSGERYFSQEALVA